MKGLVVLVVCFLVASCIEARNRNIFLRSKTLDTTGTPDYFSSELQQRHVRSSPSPSAKWLIHLKGPITRKIKTEVQNYLGVVLGQYLPQNTFMITASAEVAERAKDAPHVLWVGAYLPEYKVSDLLKTSLAPGQFEENAVRIHLDEIHAAERSLLALQWARVLKSQNIDVTFEIVGRTDMIANTKSIEQTTSWLAEQHETIWLEPVPIFRPTNQWSTRVTQGGAFNVAQQPLLHRYQIFGAGQQIAVGDTNLNRDSCFFKGASVNVDCTFLPDKSCASSTAHDHGTHVAGTLVGKPEAPLNVHTGYAPSASLYHIPLPYSADPTNPEGVVITPPRSLFDFFQAASTSGARVVLSSFSSTDAGYTLNDREVDDFVYSNPNLLLVFPAGNNGAKGPGTIGAPASSKNGITVGSSQNQIGALRKGYPNNAAVSDAKYSELFGETILATHSSRGPTTDQRFKPDIVAPGEVIFSASAAGCATQDGAVVGLSGTSMAAAAVAGAATLVRDYLAQSFYGPSGSAGLGSPITTPTAAMIKAILINSGVPLAGVQGSGAIGEFSKFLYFSGTPDGYQGFGRVDLSKVLHLNGTGSKPFFLERNSTKSVSTGQTETYCFTAPAGARVKATLVWSDPPAAVSTSVALVNNLDLILVDRLTGREFRSNGWDRYDDVNNVEQVEIVNPNPGNTFFAVYVHGTNIPVGGSQRYSLVISGGINIDTNAAACSQGVCPNLCSSRGTCNNGKCQCNQGFFGVDCSLSVCPNNCGSNKDPTVRRGSCNYETHTCICDPRFTGADCSEIKKGLDTIVITTDTGLSTPVVAGAICGAVFGGLLLGILVGYFVAVKTLEAQRRKRREQLLRQGK